MIKSIKIQNYKLFKSFTIEELPRILLIGGKNNCGKTTALESIFMPLDCGNPAMFIRPLDWRGLKAFSGKAESLFAPAFYNLNLDEPITFEYSINSSKKKLMYRYRPSVEQPIVFHDKNRIELQKKMNDTLCEIEILYGIGKSKHSNQAFLKFKPDSLSLTNQRFLEQYNEGTRAFFSTSTLFFPKEDARRFSDLDKINKTIDIVNALKTLEPRLKSLSVIVTGDVPVIHGDNGIGTKIPLSLMGQGMVRLLSILLVISEAKNGIVLIDEMENGFHYSILPLIWKAMASYAKSNNTQIIATTHSRELISGAIEGLPENVKDDFLYMRIERNRDEFKIKNYSFEDLNLALEAELEIR